MWTRVAVADMRTLAIAVLVVAAAAGAAVGPVPAAAADQVTLTVAVETPDGSPVSGAELNVTWENGSRTATTASNGKAFVDVPAGERVEIRVDHPDYVRNFPVVVESAEEQDVTVTVRQTATLSVNVSGPNGAVTDANVRVTQDGRTVATGTTDGDGKFATGEIERSEYRLVVTKPTYYEHAESVSVSGDATADVSLEPGSVQLQFSVNDDHFSPARVLENVSIAVSRDGSSIGTVTTLSDGKATVSVPVNVGLSVRADKPHYVEKGFDTSVEESDKQVTFNMRRTPELNVTVLNSRIVAGERLVVEVVDEYDEPVAGATVTVAGEEVGTTNEEGELRSVLEETGTLEVTAAKGDLTSAPVEVRVVSGDTDTTTTTTTTTTATAEDTTTSTTATPTQTQSDGGVPGFTVLTALAGLALVAARRLGR